MHVAAYHGNVGVMRHLIWYGANVNAREGCSGYSALHLAVERGDIALLQFLLQCQGIKPEIETYGGKTALEVNPSVTPEIMTFLRSKGVPTPYPSDDDDEDDSEDEVSIFFMFSVSTCHFWTIVFLYLLWSALIYLRLRGHHFNVLSIHCNCCYHLPNSTFWQPLPHITSSVWFSFLFAGF